MDEDEEKGAVIASAMADLSLSLTPTDHTQVQLDAGYRLPSPASLEDLGADPDYRPSSPTPLVTATVNEHKHEHRVPGDSGHAHDHLTHHDNTDNAHENDDTDIIRDDDDNQSAADTAGTEESQEEAGPANEGDDAGDGAPVDQRALIDLLARAADDADAGPPTARHATREEEIADQEEDDDDTTSILTQRPTDTDTTPSKSVPSPPQGPGPEKGRGSKGILPQASPKTRQQKKEALLSAVHK